MKTNIIVAVFALGGLGLLVGCAGSSSEVRSDEEAPVDAPSSSPASEPSSAPTSDRAAYPSVKLEEGPRAVFWTDEAVVSSGAIEKHISWLSDDRRQGRGVGTKGLLQASDYIAKQFEEAGLEPAGDEGGWFQTFEVVVGTELASRRGQELSSAKLELALDKEWRPFAFSASGKLDAEVVFVGYGISAEEHGYDDYAGVDVKGKVVLVLRHEPQRDDPHSAFNGAKPSRYSDLRYKAHVASKNGAVGMIVINDPLGYETPKERDPDDLYAFQGSAQAGIVSAHVTWKAGGAFVSGALGFDLKAAQTEIDAKLKAKSVALGKKVKLSVDIVRKREQVRNVVGVVRPAKALDEVVVVGAHYDHLGFGGEGSLRPDSSEVHNGADDNASGTGVMLELARASAGAKDKLERPVYFVAFTAEEIGIRGSQYFVDHPPVDKGRIAVMLNFDMVGRLRDETLHVSGVGTAMEFATLTDKAAHGTGLKIVPGRDGYGPSDHSPFYAKEVPVLFLFTGAHDQYHTPDDDFELINTEGAGVVARYAYRLLGYLASADKRPTYTQADKRASGDHGGTGTGGYGPWLGTVPSFGDTGGKGVVFQGIRAGSPAEKAGMRPGDRMVKFDGTAIKDLYDLTYALRDHKVGDTVEIVVVRGDEELTVSATLGARK